MYYRSIQVSPKYTKNLFQINCVSQGLCTGFNNLSKHTPNYICSLICTLGVVGHWDVGCCLKQFLAEINVSRFLCSLSKNTQSHTELKSHGI